MSPLLFLFFTFLYLLSYIYLLNIPAKPNKSISIFFTILFCIFQKIFILCIRVKIITIKTIYYPGLIFLRSSLIL